jgi:hypothetical protein
VDTREIREVSLLSLEDLAAMKDRLLQRDSGGLHYRAALTEAAIEEIRSGMENRDDKGLPPSAAGFSG